MVHRGQEPACPPPSQPSRLPSKKNSACILASLQQLWAECFPAFSQDRLAFRAQALSLSSLLCLGRHTITGLLTTCGQEFHDWSADYRLFSRHRLPLQPIFSVIRRDVLAQLPPAAPLSVAIDDTLLRKTGIHIPGVAWRRDPLGPKFQTNFVRAQRFLQLSANIDLPGQIHRMIPIAFQHAPTLPKPSAKASKEQLSAYRKAAHAVRLSLLAAQQISALRKSMDDDADGSARWLHVFGDGGQTNSTVLKALPARTVFTGRIRKDAALYFLPPQTPSRKRVGRPRRYGAPAPTPEALRTDESVPWQSLSIAIDGSLHTMRVKVLPNVLWRAAGLGHALQLVVVAPLGYRLRKGSKMLYTKPAFLICTDPLLALTTLLQGYVHRWDIEVNFREEKTLLGVGQAQVRSRHSVEDVPALQVASYAMLLLATIHASQASPNVTSLPVPKWSASQTPPRLSTQRAINQLRAEVWGHALGLPNIADFVSCTPPDAKPEKFLPHLPSALFYANN